MKMEVIVVLLMIIVSIIGMSLVVNTQEDTQEESDGSLYQGPVPLGKDLGHFRKTGITKNISIDG